MTDDGSTAKTGPLLPQSNPNDPQLKSEWFCPLLVHGPRHHRLQETSPGQVDRFFLDSRAL